MEKHIVELEPGVWTAAWSGDPGRTLDRKAAKEYHSAANAQRALRKARECRPFLGALILAVLAVPALADWDRSQSPTRPPPPDRWGRLRPVIHANCGALRQSPPCVLLTAATAINPLIEPGEVPFPSDVALAGDSLLVIAAGRGWVLVEMLDPTRPLVYRFASGIKIIKTDQAEGDVGEYGVSDKNRFEIRVATAPGDATQFYASGDEHGFMAIDIADPRQPFYRYQDGDAFVKRVYATGTHVVTLDNTATLRLYDRAAISKLDHCYEQEDDCPGAFKGKWPKGRGTGGAIGGGREGRFLVYRNFLELKIFDIRELATARRQRGLGRLRRGSLANLPPVRLKATFSGVTDIGEVALWETSSGISLAVAVGTRDGGQVWVYDVNCITGEGPCELPRPVIYSTPDNGSRPPPLNLDLSWGGRTRKTPYLHVGTSAIADSCTPQREYFFEATDPSAMVDLTPQVPGKPYWGWFDEECADPACKPACGGDRACEALCGGFNRTAPEHAVMVSDDVFCVARHTDVDCHGIVPAGTVPPVDPDVIFADGFESGELWER